MRVNDSATSRCRDYLELTKPRVVALMLLTAIVGMYLAAPQGLSWSVVLWGNLGIALTAGSAAVINHLVDRRIDVLMGRTQRRPIPTGKITQAKALIFSLLLGIAGMAVLITFVNLLTALLSFITLMGYAVVYTMYLKRATPQNIVIGGAAGAAPPLLGWTAVTGHIDPYAWLLVLIIFVWTPPHFWALAIYRYKEYARAEIPMLPVTHGVPFTKLSILLYTLLLLVVTTLPFITHMSGWFYFIGSLILGIYFLWSAWCLYRTPEESSAQTKAGVATFRYSIVYLMLLFALLLVDHYLLFAP